MLSFRKIKIKSLKICIISKSKEQIILLKSIGFFRNINLTYIKQSERIINQNKAETN
jgi:hypothetical protein